MRFALDDGPPAGVLGPRVPFAQGAVLLRLALPRAARVACRGTLTLRAGGARLTLRTQERGVSRVGPRGVTATLAGRR